MARYAYGPIYGYGLYSYALYGHALYMVHMVMACIVVGYTIMGCIAIALYGYGWIYLLPDIVMDAPRWL